MAPTSPVKRVTRARAAAKNTDTSNDAAKRKAAASKVTKTTAARKTKATTEEPPVEEVEPPKKASTKSTKATTAAAAPRRRIKVTPLDAPAAVEEPEPEPPKAKTKTTKTATARSKTTAPAKETIVVKAVEEESETQPKTRTRVTKTAQNKTTAKEEPAPKTRGRPKRAAVAEAPEAPKTRQTRTRAASNTEPVEESAEPAPKPKSAARKKVTFQDLPEDDKENQPMPTRKTTTKKETTPATGIRAKPIRKPTAATTKKATATSKSKVTKAASRALTPKKVPQINRLSTPESSEGEDELSGSKTPVRDLSLSPKRNTQLGARLSPVKTLSFAQSLGSPGRASEPAVLFSPARRPASPLKEMKENSTTSPLKESPRRAEVPPFFARDTEQTVSTAIFAPPSMSQSLLLQSPKRVVLDNNAFSQSAMKPTTSSFKQSLLQSPARRLFSPEKRKTPKSTVKTFSAATPEDIAISSHFRASVSPQRSGRVHRMSNEELAEEMKDTLDFDQSILSVRSPLKLAKPVQPPTVPEDDDEMSVENSSEGAAPETYGQQVPVSDVVDMHEAASSSEQDHETTPSESAEEDSTIIVASQRPTVTGPRLSEVLFRSNRFREEDESSEDELAADMTPDRAPGLFRSSLTGAGRGSRLSTVAPSSLSRDVGFTPLAAQMSGWLAASPDKKSVKKQESQGTFSPLAAQHIDGEVQVSRQLTPQQHKSPLSASPFGSSRSIKSRMSLAPSMGPSPEKTSFFEEQMTAHDVDEQMGTDEDMPVQVAEDQNQIFDEEASELEEQQVNVVPEDQDGDTIVVEQGNGELTTDLINFTNASDTAMVDFATLAEEAEQMAPSDEITQESSAESSVYGDENAAPIAREVVAPEAALEVEIIEEPGVDQLEHVESMLSPPAAQEEVEMPQPAASISGSPSAPTNELVEMATPVRPDLSLPRFANTVVSKVPLRPEGDLSPIKMAKKRSRSLSTAGHNESPPKRAQFTPIGKLAPRSTSENTQSPSRNLASTAPSPAHTAPGQMSFALDDFGESTLDGIDLPEEEMDFDIGPPTATATPATAKSVRTVKSVVPTPNRTPLKSVGGGVLHGAVVYVEVHTTEGADASGVYVDLLTQMGARCVREWRWNPRASISGAEDSANPSKVGVTHVVYKDGGKRTLEKVRDTKGEVWCVGVRWVLE